MVIVGCAQLRHRELRLIASRTAKLPWSRGLISTLLDELNIDAMFTELIGRPQGLATRKIPQALALRGVSPPETRSSTCDFYAEHSA